VLQSPSNFLEAFQDGAIPSNTQTASMTIFTPTGGLWKADSTLMSCFNFYKKI
jgi:hypothetical protein